MGSSALVLSVSRVAALLTGFLAAVCAQQFVPLATDVTSVLSNNYPGASISYKQNNICETTAGVRSWSGYVHLPSSLVPDASYDTSLFFWYFESRNNSAHAPTTLYIPGGPGTSFLDGGSAFPCDVNADSNSTTLNPWSFNGAVNMLYVDTPVQTGYSYVNPQNGTVDLFTYDFTPLEDSGEEPETNLTTVQATISSQDNADTLNTTQQVARIMWTFAQVWFQEFPEYKTDNKELNVWGYSYSGFFAPAIFAHFQRQNEKIASGTLPDSKSKPLQLGAIGINNGCIDAVSQGPAYPEFAYNNTYGIQVISKEVYDEAKHNMTKPGGCLDTVDMCRALANAGDPQGLGTNQTVNQVCQAATLLCFIQVQGAYNANSNRSPFDLTLALPAALPPAYQIAYYNQRWVQEALGVPVNYTYAPKAPVQNFFAATGDPFRYDGKADLEYLASTGVKISFVYGDKDYRCNWLGAENTSLVMDYPAADSFRKAGYANIATNGSYTGGLVRQHANVSFSRVFDAGHAVAAYQPETVFRIFERAIFGRDVATGEVASGNNYSTSGPLSSFGTKNKLPTREMPSVCYLYELETTCTPDELAALKNGTAVVKDYVVTLPGTGNGGGSGNGSSGNKTSDQNVAGKVGTSLSGVGVVSLALGLTFLSL
ncbi:Alpha/Beta hydrolase protein [Coniochaeta sp. 2T2.1]|nr:Alpha/Beta hydrolase protein [Coniochaeta sp. 2T2.1]